MGFPVSGAPGSSPSAKSMQRIPENVDKGNAAQSHTSLNLVSIRLNLDSSILRLPYRLIPNPESQICGHCGFDRRRIFEMIEETAVPRYIIRGNGSAVSSRIPIPDPGRKPRRLSLDCGLCVDPGRASCEATPT